MKECTGCGTEKACEPVSNQAHVDISNCINYYIASWMINRCKWLLFAVFSMHAELALAQQPPAIEKMSAPVSTSSEAFGAISTVRLLANGRMLVNDMIGRRVVLLDSSLAEVVLVADTTGAGYLRYSSTANGLIPFLGDSSLLVDPASLSMTVIDAFGRPNRTIATPRAADVTMLLGGPGGRPGVDRLGRLIYRAPPSRDWFRASSLASPSDAGRGALNVDSSALLRADLHSRLIDTIGFLRFSKLRTVTSADSDGIVRITVARNPIPLVDDWAVTSDGTTAFVRGADYHIDWNPKSGNRTETRIPHEWHHLTDSEKVAIVDSARAAALRLLGLATRLGVVSSKSEQNGSSVPVDAFVFGIPKGTAASRVARRPQNISDSALRARDIHFVEATELRDYMPPLVGGEVYATPDGGLWIGGTEPGFDALVYDVLDSSGQLVARVAAPSGRIVVAIGVNGTVFTAFRFNDHVYLEARRVLH